MVIRLIFAALMLAWTGTVSYADQDSVRCVQSQLSEIGFDAGKPDGEYGKRTARAADSYVREWRSRSSDLKRLLAEHGALDASNANAWCSYLEEKHPKQVIGPFAFRKAEVVPAITWQANLENGWVVRLVGANPTDEIVHLSLFIHGDETDFDSYVSRCFRVSSLLAPGYAMACIFRPYATNRNMWRQPEEVAEITEIVKNLSSTLKVNNLHCSGHSSGGHLCLAIAQQEAVDISCIAVSAPPADTVEHHKAGWWNIGARERREYNPADHVAKTVAYEIIITGDKEDPTVSHKSWESFIGKARAAGIDIKFVEVSGFGHRQSTTINELNSCIHRSK